MQVFVKNLNGETIALQLEASNETIHRVKDLVHATIGIPRDKIRLVYGALRKQLNDDDKTLDDYSIDDESTLHLSCPLLSCRRCPEAKNESTLRRRCRIPINHQQPIYTRPEVNRKNLVFASFFKQLVTERYEQTNERSTCERHATRSLIDEVDLSGDISAKLRAYVSSMTGDWQTEKASRKDVD